MALTQDQITAQNFKDFYGQIRPYLNGQVPTFANAFSRSDLYSTDEKIIGTWTDGKPIYQKIVVEEVTTYSDGGQGNTRRIFSYDLNMSPNDYYILPTSVVMVEATLSGNTVERIYPSVPFYGFQDQTRVTGWTMPYIQTNLSQAYTKLQFMSSTGYGATKCKFIAALQYTKTNDTAIKVGTGNDYSTDEQIIGTWTSGKPLYQRSWTGLSVAVTTDNTNWQVFSGVNIPNGNLIKAFFLSNDGKVSITPQECWIRTATGNLETLYWPENRTISDVTLCYTKTT